MIVTLDDCTSVMERLAVHGAAEGRHDAAGNTLSCIRVADGPGAVLLSAALSPEERPHVTVDCTPRGLVIRCGAVARMVPLPADALLDHAVVQVSAEGVTVTMPIKERRERRHLVYVW